MCTPPTVCKTGKYFVVAVHGHFPVGLSDTVLAIYHNTEKVTVALEVVPCDMHYVTTAVYHESYDNYTPQK